MRSDREKNDADSRRSRTANGLDLSGSEPNERSADGGSAPRSLGLPAGRLPVSLPALNTLPAPSPTTSPESGRASGNRLVSTGLRQDCLDERGPILQSFADAAAADLARAALGLETARGLLENGADAEQPGGFKR